MRLFIIFTFLIISDLTGKINSEFDVKCTEKYCTNLIVHDECPELNSNCMVMNSSHHGIHLKYPDTCNCCEYCLSSVRLGENCMRGYPGSLPLSISVCGHGLSCTTNDVSTCQRMRTNCTQAQDAWDERRKSGNLGMTEVRPNCDSNGHFTSTHCIPGSICYCRAPTGERIFGEIPFLNSWDEQTMTCGCALNDWKMRNTLDMEQWNSTDATSITGERCTADGHYDEMQCMMGNAAKCFCIDTVSGRPRRDTFTFTNITDIRDGHPSCFNPALHEPGKYSRPCELLIMSPNKSFTNLRCQPDGMFHRLQILGSRNICVDPLGVQITYQGIEYGADVDTDGANKMDCNCARNVWLLSKFAYDEIPKCCSNGNFESWQCRRNLCFCVDNNGNQLGLEMNIEDLLELPCYNNGKPCEI